MQHCPGSSKCLVGRGLGSVSPPIANLLSEHVHLRPPVQRGGFLHRLLVGLVLMSDADLPAGYPQISNSWLYEVSESLLATEVDRFRPELTPRLPESYIYWLAWDGREERLTCAELSWTISYSCSISQAWSSDIGPSLASHKPLARKSPG
jgi:hypothetical protein